MYNTHIKDEHKGNTLICYYIVYLPTTNPYWQQKFPLNSSHPTYTSPALANVVADIVYVILVCF
jgi:hypothetical protein